MPRTYTMTVESVLTPARAMLNDDRPEMDLRAADPELITALNEAIAAMVGIVPGLFAQQVAHACQAGARQALQNDRAVALLDIPGLPEADLETLNLYAPGWTTSTPGAVREFLRLPGEPLAFMVWPPAVADAALTPRAVLLPEALEALEDPIELPEVFAPALVEYVVGRVEMKDDEHVDSTRASQLMERFAAGVKALATP